MTNSRAAGPSDALGIFIEVACALSLGSAIVALWVGPWRVQAFNATLSIGGITRPLTMVVVLLIIRWLSARQRAVDLPLIDSFARVVAGALLFAGIAGWFAHLSPYVGGSDSYGYVSASERIRQGALIQHEPLAPLLPYPNGIAPATPLGYVASPRVANATVPAYPLGLPALMAVAATMGGQRGPLYVALGMGLVLIGVCGWLVYRWTDDASPTRFSR